MAVSPVHTDPRAVRKRREKGERFVARDAVVINDEGVAGDRSEGR
jgi:hypothetical protein